MSVLPFRRFLFLHVRVLRVCDVVGINAERWEVRIWNHRRGDVDYTIVIIVCLSFRREIAEVIDETFIQPLTYFRRGFVMCQIEFRWKLQIASLQ